VAWFWLQNILEMSSSGMKDFKVWRVERTSIQGTASLEVSPKVEKKTSPALFKKAENTFI